MKLLLRKENGCWLVSIAGHHLAAFQVFDDARRFINGERLEYPGIEQALHLKESLDAITDQILGNYIMTHKLSRGAPVGRA